MSKKRVPDRRYPQEFKLEAVKLAEAVGINEAARRLEMSNSSIGNWVRAQRAGKLAATADGVRPLTETEAELSRLRKENASLKLDNEILRKAAAYFVRESR